MALKTKDGQIKEPSNDEELFYSLTNDLFEALNIPPILVGGSWNEAVLKMQAALIKVKSGQTKVLQE